MKPNRISSKLKQKQLQTKYLQEQTKKMQQKLNELKKQVEQQKQLKAATNLESTITRWKKVTRTDAPLKSYAKQVLEQQKQAYKKYGIDEKKITGTKTFSNIKKKIIEQKQQQEHRNPSKIPSLMSKASMNSQKSLNKDVIQKVQLPIQTIQNNFMKAKMDIKNLIKQKTVLEFLEEIFLQQYHYLFQQNNITELSDLRYVTKQQLQYMGIAKGHQIKIMKRIKEQFQKSKSPMKNPFFKVQQQKKQEKQQEKQQKEQKKMVQMGYGQGDVNDYADIQIRENQQKQDHAQLINGSDQHHNFEQAESQNQSEQQNNDVVLITVPLSQIALQTGYQEGQEENQISMSMAENCFSCYKLIPLKNQLFQSPDNRNFCSANCLKLYKLQMQKTCPECRKQFFKTQGFYEEGFWFCSLGCCPNKNQIEQMFLEWTTKRSAK